MGLVENIGERSAHLAPVAVFGYRRPEKLQVCLESLAACPEASETSVTIFIDGPRSALDISLVHQSRRVAESVRGFKDLRVVTRLENRGLAVSIISGVTEMLRLSNTVIVVEDDLTVSRGFLTFMNAALNLYEGDDEVVSVHGYCYPVVEELPATFFLRGADCWGWATWRRGWDLFDPDPWRLLRRLEASKDKKLFDFNGTFPFSKMLRDQAEGTIDSWAIRWYASAFLHGKVTLYPGKSLVTNHGFDGSGSHPSTSSVFHVEATPEPPQVTRSLACESPLAREAFERYFAKSSQNQIIDRFLAIARRLQKSIFGWLRRTS
jgi:hypothetical protein